MKQADSEHPEAERIFAPLWPVLPIGGAFFLVLVRGLSEPSPSPHVALGAACLLAGFGIWTTINFVVRDMRSSKRSGDVHRFFDNYINRVRTFLFDNPEVAADSRVRRALIPSDEELRLMRIHPSRLKTFGEFREGTHWMVRGGTHLGPSVKLDLCLKPRGHDARRRTGPSDGGEPLAGRVGYELLYGRGRIEIRLDRNGDGLLLTGGWVQELLRITKE